MLRLTYADDALPKLIANTLKVWVNDYITEIKGYPDTMYLYGNAELEEIYLNKLETIGEDVFGECEKLKKVFLPKIKTIDSIAFELISTLEEVHIGSDIISIASDAFDGSDNQNLKIYINKPQGSVSSAPWGSTTAQVIWQG